MEISLQRRRNIPPTSNDEHGKAHEKAWDKKTAVFSSGLTGLLSRPKAEDVQFLTANAAMNPSGMLFASVL